MKNPRFTLKDMFWLILVIALLLSLFYSNSRISDLTGEQLELEKKLDDAEYTAATFNYRINNWLESFRRSFWTNNTGVLWEISGETRKAIAAFEQSLEENDRDLLTAQKLSQLYGEIGNESERLKYEKIFKLLCEKHHRGDFFHELR